MAHTTRQRRANASQYPPFHNSSGTSTGGDGATAIPTLLSLDQHEHHQHQHQHNPQLLPTSPHDGLMMHHSSFSTTTTSRRSVVSKLSMARPPLSSPSASSSSQRYYSRGRYYSKIEILAMGLCTIGTMFVMIQLFGLASFLRGTLPMIQSPGFEHDKRFFDNLKHLPVLIVGGTDGSGTRAFVDTLSSIGVPIIADDPNTFDIHASMMFQKLGWPKLVTTILEATDGNVQFQWDDLPRDTQRIVQREVRLLVYVLGLKYADFKRKSKLTERLPRRPSKAHGPMQTSRGIRATDMATEVAFAIKAPVSMLVLPVLRKFMGPIKFLHVVRDGRDIALSNNQSPVLKFYNATYKDYQERSDKFQGDLYPVRAMQLWNDWNTEVQQWALGMVDSLQQENKNANGNSNAPSFEYLVMRTEDMIDPSTKFHCLKRLAEYVGSPMSDKDLCCLARTYTKDYGISTTHSEAQNNFGAHPEEWDKMGKRRGRKPEWMQDLEGRKQELLEGGEEDWNDQPKGGVRRVPRTLKDDNQELEALEASLQERQAELKAKEDELNERQKSLEALQESLEQQQGSNFTRRRLSSDQATPRLVPSQFLKQLSYWQESVETHSNDYQSETLQKLLNFGKSLEKQYLNNVSALTDIVSIQEIRNTCKRLELAIKKRGGAKNVLKSPHELKRMTKERKEEMHKNVHGRYGKWKTQLENRTELSHWLHQEGNKGLALFGYEPRLDWTYLVRNATSFQCDEKVECGAHGSTHRAESLVSLHK